eukprot:4839524-Prymnesium_polylepis.1
MLVPAGSLPRAAAKNTVQRNEVEKRFADQISALAKGSYTGVTLARLGESSTAAAYDSLAVSAGADFANRPLLHLDGLRTLAATYIAVVHYASHFGEAVGDVQYLKEAIAIAFVDYFAVVSGFTTHFTQSPVDLMGKQRSQLVPFYSRVLRLVPAVTVAGCFSLFVSWLITGNAFRQSFPAAAD